MSLAVRVIPTLLMRGNQLVKGKRFDSWRSVGVIEQAIRVHNQRGCDEIILLDITATPKNRGPDFALIEKLADSCFCPLTVGGGVRSVEDARRLLECGADKVAIGTAYHAAEMVAQWIGAQAVVASVDVQAGDVFTACGSLPLRHMPVQWCVMLEHMGVGEILLTSIDREGTMVGYDLELIHAVSCAVNIPVIAHGGCNGPDDMIKAVRAGASAVAAGALFQFTDCTPRDCAEALARAGIEARVAA